MSAPALKADILYARRYDLFDHSLNFDVEASIRCNQVLAVRNQTVSLCLQRV